MTAHTENHAHGTNDQIRTISRTTKTAYHPTRMNIRSGGTMVKKDWTFNKTIKTKKIKNQKNKKK